MPVIWTKEALADLEQIRRRVARERPVAAEHLVGRLLDSTERLLQFPLSGRRVPEAADPAVRELIVTSYRIIYRVRVDRVTIWRVFHSSRVLKAKHLRHMR